MTLPDSCHLNRVRGHGLLAAQSGVRTCVLPRKVLGGVAMDDRQEGRLGVVCQAPGRLSPRAAQPLCARLLDSDPPPPFDSLH